MMYAIEINDVGKTYAATGKSPQKTALEHIDLKIPKGSIFGLLGPNGAGKSTLINIMAGLVIKTSGQVKIWGTDQDENARQARANIGIVPQEINYDPFFTPAKLLDLQAGMYGVPKPERWTAGLLEMVGLTDKANAYTRSLSGGMRRRLMLAKAMVHRPPILVLDEPTAGVDIQLRQNLWENVKVLNKRGVTVLLTTHYLEEAEELCDSIAIIHKGKIVANDSKENLLANIDGKEIRFRLDRDIGTLPETFLAHQGIQEGNRTVMFRFSPKEKSVDQLIELVRGAGFGISDISTDDRNLEDVFLQMTR